MVSFDFLGSRNRWWEVVSAAAESDASGRRKNAVAVVAIAFPGFSLVWAERRRFLLDEFERLVRDTVQDDLLEPSAQFGEFFGDIVSSRFVDADREPALIVRGIRNLVEVEIIVGDELVNEAIDFLIDLFLIHYFLVSVVRPTDRPKHFLLLFSFAWFLRREKESSDQRR